MKHQIQRLPLPSLAMTGQEIKIVKQTQRRKTNHKMKKRPVVRTVITILAVLVALGAIGAVLTKNKKSNEAKTSLVAQTNNAISVKTFTVSRQEVNQDFNVNGTFAPAAQLNFASEMSGRITRILVDEGNFVRKGQTLAIINTDAIALDLQTAQATYNTAAADLQRFESAYSTGGVTKQQLDQAKLNYQNSKSRLGQAKIRVGDAHIKASINGIVNKRYIEPGAVVSPGTQLFELVDVSRLKLNVNVSESQVAQLKVGDKVAVKASVYPDKTFTGRVTFIAAKADAALNFPVEIEIENNAGNDLKAGMYGTAMFDFPGAAPTLIVPRAAFVGGVNSNEVFVMDGNQTVHLKQVTAGRIFGNQVEILGGLDENDVVITSGQINLVDGSKVAPIQ